jgi:predicted CoA-substrate-specific enzyme activase
MITAGCDLGSTTGKAAILIDDKIYCGDIIAATTKPALTATLAMDSAIQKAGLKSIDEIEYIIGTGYGRQKVPFANDDISEISCHGKGAFWTMPSVRTIIDIGGQDCKAISISEKGVVTQFEMNERCAAGTGRFFQVMAKVLTCGLEGIGDVSNISETPVSISNQCSVFAESEVITLINDETPIPDIITGINQSVAKRVVSLVRRVGINNDVTLTGGCSKNNGLKKALEDLLGTKIQPLPIDPQSMGAVGAAVFAMEKLKAKKAKEALDATTASEATEASA